MRRSRRAPPWREIDDLFHRYTSAVGLPRTGSQAGLARSFCRELEAMLSIPVDTYDERLTSRMADASRRGGAAAARDSLAAAHLLESYLESSRPAADETDEA